ncbi:MAG: hypothetical protein E7463_13265 [Ruminococcaceae bacterium]|nr:hypothetical protein [Oscillospiraceae bacterium]
MKKNLTMQISSIAAVVLVILLIGGFLLADMLDVAGGSDIVLPTGPAMTTDAGVRGEVWEGNTELEGVEVTVDNVAAVIATLERPVSYTMTAVVDRSDGTNSSQTRVTHAVHNGMTSTTAVRDGETLKTIRADGKVYIWDARQKVSVFNEGAFGEDAAAGLPGYEVVHELEEIRQAGYAQFEGYDCIWFSAEDRELKCTSVYYVDIASGLLIASETMCGDTRIYQMRAETILAEMPDASLFILPDGRSFMS